MKPDEFNVVNVSFRENGKTFVHWSNVKIEDASHRAIKLLKRRKAWKGSIIIRRFAFTFRLGRVWGYRGVFVESGREQELSTEVQKLKK